MEFWNNVSDGLDWLGRNIETFGQDTVRATKEFSQVQKLRGEISQAERQINTQYLRLGKKYYAEHKDDPELSEDPMFRSISDNLSRMEACEREIAQVRASRENAEEAAAAARAAHDAAAEEASQERASRADSPEVQQANAEDDIVDYQTMEPADESDFAEEDAFEEDDDGTMP